VARGGGDEGVGGTRIQDTKISILALGCQQTPGLLPGAALNL